MQLAIGEGCEYLDVELTWPAEVWERVAAIKGSTMVVASFHDWTGNLRWTSDSLRENYEKADRLGGMYFRPCLYAASTDERATDIIKLSILSTDICDCHELALFVRDHTTKSSKPLIAVGMGPQGQLSRITSPISLVTHELLPFSAASGQLTMSQIHQAMHLLGQIPARRFFIWGNNISHSLSPVLHNIGFKELGLSNYHYRIHETEAVDEEIRLMMHSPDFGGASVTFPHKLHIGKFLDRLSESAKLIGAVNTVVVEEEADGSRILRGENTDWLGIKSCIEERWKDIRATTPWAAIVIGAGGASRAACFAIQELGVRKIYLVNRTTEKVEAVARDFPKVEFEIMPSLRSLRQALSPAPSIIVACIPADEIVEDDIPVSIFEAATEGVLVEMAYRPPVTALMRVAGHFPGWDISQGTDVLKEQAYHQFSMWTGRRAPVEVMQEALEKRIRCVSKYFASIK